MENSLRRKEEKRKNKREELAERKKKELEQRSLEIKQLKKIKKKEIVDRIRKLQEITGNKGVGFEVSTYSILLIKHIFLLLTFNNFLYVIKYFRIQN